MKKPSCNVFCSMPHILTFLWIVFSLVYIVWDFTDMLKTKYYLSGHINARQQIIQEAQKCKSFEIFTKEPAQKVELINVDCLKKE